MKLKHFGYNHYIKTQKTTYHSEDFDIGRVISEHKERYIVSTEKGDLNAEITGHLRYTAHSRIDFPAVGDWVTVSIYDSNNAIIHDVLPRYTTLSRKAIARSSDVQIIATNIDYAFIVQAVDRDFNINRMERYLTICYSANIQPILILSKIDLVTKAQLFALTNHIQERIQNVPVFTISNTTKQGYESLKSYIIPQNTYCCLGSSGVGKSTLVNILAEEEIMATKAISKHSQRGQHKTSHRELIILKDGGILIDTPGMREVGIDMASHNIENTFNTIAAYAKDCKFKDCSHTVEVGCAVIEALNEGMINKASYQNYLKMKREQEHLEASNVEKRKKDKNFGKMVKQFKQLKHKRNYE
jgi:ribosome biogenesis GTPase